MSGPDSQASLGEERMFAVLNAEERCCGRD